MFVLIDDSVVDYIEQYNDCKTALILSRLDSLANAYRENYLIIFSEKDTLYRLAKNKALQSRFIFEYAHQKRRYIKKLYDLVNRTTILTLNRNEKVETNSKIEFYLSILSEKDICNSLRNVQFLNENSSDGIFYQNMAEECIVNKFRIKNIAFKLNIRGGGGSQVDVELDNCLNSAYPCLCIVDSDKILGKQKLGSTLIRVNQRMRSPEIKNKLSRFSLLEVYESLEFHEIENLIPLHFLYDKFAKTDRNKEKVSKLYEILINKELCPKYSMHLDIKEGIKKKYFVNYPDEIREEVLKITGKTYEEIQEIDDDDYIIIEGLGENVLSKVNQCTFSEVFKFHHSYCKKTQIVDEIALMVFSWGCVLNERNQAI